MLLQLTDMRHSLRDKTLRRGVRLLLPLAAAATSSGAWVACDWNVDFLSAGNGTEDAGNEPDATIRPEADSGADAGSDAGLAATDADADGAAEDGAQDATLDARPDSGMADAPPGDAACDPMAPEGGTNYVVNPGFEDPTDPGTGWFANYGGTFSVSSTQGHCGYHSGEISGRSVYYNGLGTNLPPTPGTYAITMWLLQDGTTPYQIAPSGAAVCGDAGTTSFLNIGYVTVPPNVWTYLSGTLTVPSGCTSLILAIGGNYLAPGTPNLFADDVYAVR
jgi:hypothetical protein